MDSFIISVKQALGLVLTDHYLTKAAKDFTQLCEDLNSAIRKRHWKRTWDVCEAENETYMFTIHTRGLGPTYVRVVAQNYNPDPYPGAKRLEIEGWFDVNWKLTKPWEGTVSTDYPEVRPYHV
jgi:hypothetical protein